MKLARLVAAALGCIAIGIAAPAVAATVHPSTTLVNDTDDVFTVESHCAGFDGHPTVIVGAGVHRSTSRTTNLNYDITVAWSTSGTPYTGTVQSGVSISPAAGSQGMQAWLTTDGPIENDFLVNANHVLASATNITVSVNRHSDGELEWFGRPQNIATACT